jgi:hypothetical protein
MKLDPAPTLRLWERVAGLPREQRDEALLGVAPSTLAQRNALALRQYAALFGAKAAVLGRCTHCGATVEFDVDVDACARTMPDVVDAIEWHVLDTDGMQARFRLPAPGDLSALAWVDDEATFAELLLARCMEDAQLPTSPEVRDAISRRMESVASGATVQFEIACPECAATWISPLDPVALLWEELRLHAEQLLGEIATLARHWGWSERDILRMSPIRRAAYLQLATA